MTRVGQDIYTYIHLQLHVQHLLAHDLPLHLLIYIYNLQLHSQHRLATITAAFAQHLLAYDLPLHLLAYMYIYNLQLHAQHLLAYDP